MENSETIILGANVIVVGCLIFNIVSCYKKGLILSFWECFGTIVALFFAWYFSDTLAGLIRIFPMSFTPMHDTVFGELINTIFNGYAWAIVIFVGIKLGMLVLTPLIKMIASIPLVKEVNNVLGCCFGVLLTWVWAMVAIFILSMPIIEGGLDIVHQSFLNPILENSVFLVDFVAEFIEENEMVTGILSKQELTSEDEEIIKGLMDEYDISSDWTN